jgi:hypothetical protein
MLSALRKVVPPMSGRKLASGREEACVGRLVLDRTRCSVGEEVTGRIAGLGSTTSVAILRLECRPGERRVFEVAAARASQPGGRFALALPCEAVPSATGERCGLHYVVCARSAGGSHGAELTVFASARPHVDSGSSRADRLLASWEARHFHLELSDAQLTGGGRLAGRVHRHGPWPADLIVVVARCEECWRASPWAERGVPQWRSTGLWEHACTLRADPDATWAGFEFQLPDGLPPAIEASTIAWRYELIAKRSVRHWLDETAALTALLHEHAHQRGSHRLARRVRRLHRCRRRDSNPTRGLRLAAPPARHPGTILDRHPDQGPGAGGAVALAVPLLRENHVVSIYVCWGTFPRTLAETVGVVAPRRAPVQEGGGAGG